MPATTTFDANKYANHMLDAERNDLDAWLLVRHVDFDVADARGYKPVTEEEARSILGHAPWGQNWPGGFAIPLFHPGKADSNVAQIRLTGETIFDADGKAMRFFIPKGIERGSKAGDLPADVNPATPTEWLNDPSVPLIITEGTAKGDSMLTAAIGENLPVVCVSVTGVNMAVVNGRGKGKNLHPDLRPLVTPGRRVIVAWDSDAGTNPMVLSSLKVLRGVLHSEGADVKVLALPCAADGDKQGVDDWLAAGGTMAELLNGFMLVDHPDELTVSVPRDASSLTPAPTSKPSPFGGLANRVDSEVEVDHESCTIGVTRRKMLKNGDVEEWYEPLANFSAKIVAVIAPVSIDERHQLVRGDVDLAIEVRWNHPRAGLMTDFVKIASSELDKLVTAVQSLHMGQQCSVSKGPSGRAQVANAVRQDLESALAAERFEVTSTGWASTKTGWAFAHTGGAITARGTTPAEELAVVVGTDSPLRRCVLPIPAEEKAAAARWLSSWLFTEQVAALQAKRLEAKQAEGELKVTAEVVTKTNLALSIRHVMPIGMAFAARSAMPGIANLPGASVLSGLWYLEGEPKSGKTSIANLVASHFGIEYAVRSFTSFNTKSTSAGDERTVASATNICIVIDDMRLGRSQEHKRFMAQLDSWARGAHDGQTVQRSNTDLAAKATSAVTGGIMVTGEKMPIQPDTDSHLSRMMTLCIPKSFGPVNGEVFKYFARGEGHAIAAEGMALFLRWMAAELDAADGKNPIDQVRSFRARFETVADRIIEAALDMLPPAIAASFRNSDMRSTLIAKDWALGAAAIIAFFQAHDLLDESGVALAETTFSTGFKHLFLGTLAAMKAGSASTELLSDLLAKIAGGAAHLMLDNDETAGRPTDALVAAAWGWKSDNTMYWSSSGLCVGFVRKEKLYLSPAVLEQARICTDSNGQPMTARAIRAALAASVDEKGLALAFPGEDATRHDRKAVDPTGTSGRWIVFDAPRCGIPLPTANPASDAPGTN